MAGGRFNPDLDQRPDNRPVDAITSAGDWAEHEQHYRRCYLDATYYSSGRGWTDYAPAYQYGFDNFGRFRGRRFEEAEAQLRQGWDMGRAGSRLVWAEARGAVRDIWRRIAQDKPADRDIAPESDRRHS